MMYDKPFVALALVYLGVWLILLWSKYKSQRTRIDELEKRVAYLELSQKRTLAFGPQIRGHRV